MKFNLLLFALIIVLLVNFVSAQEEVLFTCKETTDGRKCVETTDPSLCSEENPFPGPKENLPECTPGCCTFPGSSELCYENVPAAECSSNGGILRPGSCSAVNECNTGCCILGSNWDFTTENYCVTKSNELGIPLEFHEASSSYECPSYFAEQEVGCCARNLGTQCSVGTRETCSDGEFFLSSCTEVPGEQKCYNNKQGNVLKCDPSRGVDIYEFDSAGEFVGVSAECDYLNGKVCRENDGSAECADVNCDVSEITLPEYIIDNENSLRDGAKNGESWCYYDGPVGPGLDFPGSRHFIHKCVNGREIVEELKDRRGEICFNGELSNGLKQAIRVPNNVYDKSSGRTCMESETKSECEDSKWNCLWIESGSDDFELDLTESLNQDQINNIRTTTNKPGLCIPIVPPGPKKNDFSAETCSAGIFKEDSEGNLGKLIETVYWKSDVDTEFDWKCEANCQIYSDDFLKSTNALCRSYGDCGASYNLVKEFSNEGFRRDCSVNKDKYLEDISNDETNYKNELSSVILNNCDEKLDSSPEIFELKEDFLNYGNIRTGDEIFPETEDRFKIWFKEDILLPGWYEERPATSIIGDLFPVINIYSHGYLNVIRPLLNIIFDERDKTPVTFECRPWEPPRTGEFCNLCNEPGEEIDLTAGGKHPCTPYLCWSLGSTCGFIQTDASGGKCIDTTPEENYPPEITPLQQRLNENSCTGETGNTADCSFRKSDTGYKIEPFISPNTDVTIGIKTNSPSKCKFSEKHSESYETMPDSHYFEPDSQYYSEDHRFTFIKNQDIENGKEHSYYARCITYTGVESAVEYEIRFKIYPEPDTTPPLIEVTHSNNFLVPNIINSSEVTVKPNEEITECRYDIQDKPYKELENRFVCNSPSLGDEQECTFTVENLTEIKTYSFYVKCTDKNNITNPSSKSFTLRKTEKLNFDSVECKDPVSNECKGDKYYSVQEITALTSGGSDNGNSLCGGNSNLGFNRDFVFQETGTNLHSELTLGPLTRGEHNFNIVCEDSAGNIANRTLHFNILKDETNPILEKVYTSTGSLVVETSEESKCRYSSDPEKLFEEPQDFSTSDSLRHTAPIGVQKSFTIICSDRFENSFDVTNIYLP